MIYLCDQPFLATLHSNGGLLHFFFITLLIHKGEKGSLSVQLMHYYFLKVNAAFSEISLFTWPKLCSWISCEFNMEKWSICTEHGMSKPFELNGAIWWSNCILSVIKVGWVFQGEKRNRAISIWEGFNIDDMHHMYTITIGMFWVFTLASYLYKSPLLHIKHVLSDSVSKLRANKSNIQIKRTEICVTPKRTVWVYFTSSQAYDSTQATTDFQPGSALWVKKLATSPEQAEIFC